MEPWEKAFEDWERLLKVANAEELLEDPKAIWDEAWRQAYFINRNAVLEEVAKSIEKFEAFGKDTITSFSAYIRSMKE